jgi:hypothetical protein
VSQPALPAWRLCVVLVVGATCTGALAQPAAPGDRDVGPRIRRVANMPDGAPAFEVLNAGGQRLSRIECIQNGYVDADAMAARLMASQAVMAALIARQGRIRIEDLGPAVFNCVVVWAPETAAAS